MIRSHFHATLLSSLPLLLLLSKAAPAQTYDHSRLDRVLSASVSNGRVDYERIRRNDDFAAYVAALDRAKPESLPAEEQLAFWINAYNALVIREVLDNPGIRHPTDVQGFFDRTTFAVAGRKLTLNQIENDMIRTAFHEKLIHFGLVCAARSCPPLLPHAYAGRTLRADLARNAESYLASAQNSLDNAKGALLLSKIFDWYKGDFGGDAGLRAFVKSHGTPAMRAALDRSPNLPILYQEYDWTLNGR